MRRQKITSAPDYQLRIIPHFDERHQKHTTLFVLETTASFASFRYDLSVQVIHVGRTLRFEVLGLSTPKLSLPGAGQARFSTELEGLSGTFDLVVEGLDGVENRATIKVSTGRVELRNHKTAAGVIFIADRTQ